MNIIHVNNTDLVGKRFNGYDLKTTLNRLGHVAHQIVLEKQGHESTTIPLLSQDEVFVKNLLKCVENELGMSNLLNPFGKKLMDSSHMKKADIIHFHLLHNDMLSLLDMPDVLMMKPSIWTVHDPWIITGGCIHPKSCLKWQEGCPECKQLTGAMNTVNIKKTHELWKIKQEVYKQIEPYIIVSTRFMEEYIRKSPLTKHFKNIYKIPFGIEVEQYTLISREEARRQLGIPSNHYVIACRETEDTNKGFQYIVKMLETFRKEDNITLLTVGNKVVPSKIKEKHNVIQLGWCHSEEDMVRFYRASDVFIMPSLAESFGLMAIEAMAASRPVVVFENTVLEEITWAPMCGIKVPYKDWVALTQVVKRLMQNNLEGYKRGELGNKLAKQHYTYERYVKQHIELYEEILVKEKSNGGMNK